MIRQNFLRIENNQILSTRRKTTDERIPFGKDVFSYLVLVFGV